VTARRLVAVAAALVTIAIAPPALANSHAASVRPTQVGPNDPGLTYEGHWAHTRDSATTVNSGSRLLLRFTGHHLTGHFDTASITMAAQIYVSIDGRAPAFYKVDRDAIDFTPTALRGSVHSAEIDVKDVDEYENRWIPPVQSGLVLTGLQLDAGGRLLPGPRPGRLHLEFYGDSITEGVEALCPTLGVDCADGTKDYAFLTGRALHADFNQVGFGKQGIIQPGHGNVGTAAQSFGWNLQGSPTDPHFRPDAVVVNEGTNDSPYSSAEFRPGYLAYLREIRAADPQAWILAMRPFGGYHADDIRWAVQQSADPRIVYVDTTDWLSVADGDFSGGGAHPDVQGHRKAAALLTAEITALTGWRADPVARPTGPGWIGTWSAAPVPPSTSGTTATGFTDQTVRDIVHTSHAGDLVRIRVSNAFGAGPLTVDDARIGVRTTGAAVDPSSTRRLTFGRRGSVTVPAGAERLSDPVPMWVAAEQDLAVSLYFRGPTGPVSSHGLALTTSYLSAAGDHSADIDASAYPGTTSAWFVLDGVDVFAPQALGAVVAFGDSITDGAQSTPDTNQRYPDDLARRLLAAAGGRALSVLNEGISGNRLLTDAGSSGIRASARFGRDALSQTGVRAVLLLEGINDIGHNLGAEPGTPATADAVIDALRALAQRAHARGLRVIGATLTPFAGSKYDTPEAQQKRDAVNQWIRTAGTFDAVVDFDGVTRDPANPGYYLPAYDSGDHLHPNDAGYRAMADAIDLAQLR
jgi:lysophospholipase L1-like esterase